MDEALELVRKFSKMGIKKMILTPHVMNDYYPNDADTILEKKNELEKQLAASDISVQIEAAAEYYLDDHFLASLEGGERLLTFGGGHLLFETSFFHKPVYLKEAIFKMNIKNIVPVMAHPERYMYLHKEPHLMDELLEMKVKMQLNLLSLTDYYSRDVQRFAQKLIARKQLHFIGSDCHNLKQYEQIHAALGKRALRGLAKLDLHNDKLP